MQPAPGNKVIVAVWSVASLLWSAPAIADWPSSSVVNVPVCVAPNLQTVPAVTGDGLGGAIVVWQDARAGGSNFDIYAQRLLASGTVDPNWPVDGRVLSAATGAQVNPQIVSDGSGGAIVAWQDVRGGVTSDIYAQHVLASGLLDPAWNPNGQPVCSAAGNQRSVSLVSDGAGGAIVAWQDFRSDTTSDIYALRILPSGLLGVAWPSDGRALCVQPGNQTFQAIASDGSGGAIVAWQDSRGGAGSDIYAQNVRGDGALNSAWPVDGRALCTEANNQQSPIVVASKTGGAIVCWHDFRGGATSDIYAQRVGADGTIDPAWTVGGQVLCAAVGNQQTPKAVSDGSDGALLAWADFRGGGLSDVYAQHVLASGSVGAGWLSDGRAVCTAAGNQNSLSAASDGSGGVLLVWTDARNGGVADVYGQHVLGTGSMDPAWPSDGRALCTATGSQSSATILGEGSGGAIVAWSDGRLGGPTGIDVYAQRVQANGQLGGSVVAVPNPEGYTFALGSVRPNPWSRGALTVALSLADDDAAWLEILDVGGRRIVLKDVGGVGPGLHYVAVEQAQQLSPGIYFVRLQQRDHVSTGRFVVLE